MAIQTKVQWNSQTLEMVFRELYTRAGQDKTDHTAAMYAMETSEKDTESIEMIGGEGLMEEWGQSGNSVKYEDVNELWQKYFTHKKYSDGRMIEKDWFDDLKLTKIKDRVTSLADSVYKTRQMQGAQFFNNMALTSTALDYKGRTYNAALPDGKALVATDHPYSPTNSTDTQSNKGTSELDIDAWDTTTTLMAQWVDDKGNLMGRKPTELWVAPYNARKALQIAGINPKGVYEPDSANFNINVYQGDIKVVVNPFILPAFRKYWMAVDPMQKNMALKWFDRRKPEYGNISDFNTETLQYKVIGRWSFGTIDYSWCYGHTPA